MRTVIFPYKMGSQSARLLSDVLDAVRVRAEGRYLPRRGDFIINWGNSVTPTWMNAYRAVQGAVFLNKPENVANAANKLRTFRILEAAGVSIPNYFTHASEVVNLPGTFYGRSVLTGHSGAGIHVLRLGDRMVECPLYTEAIENDGEYRVHVMNGEVIDYIKKRRRSGEQPNQEQNDIRNLANGWVYTRENLRRLERIEQLAINAVAALSLDFGAVDIIKNPNGDVFVLEVNTACGMSDTTLELYSEAFSDLIETHASNNN